MILKKRNVNWMIFVYLVVCGAIAWGLYNRFCAFELNSFIGSFAGGVLGGLGTLLTVYVTIGSTYDVIAESRRSERKKFVDDIGEELGEYIADISTYFYDNKSQRESMTTEKTPTNEPNRKRSIALYYTLHIKLYKVWSAYMLLQELTWVHEASCNGTLSREKFNSHIELLKEASYKFKENYLKAPIRSTG